MSEKKFDYDVYNEKKTSQNTSLPIAKIVGGLVFVILIFISISSYNSLVTKDEQVSEAYSQIESNMQRKLDLLPNLVKVVKAYAAHESELLTKITKLRSSRLPSNVKDMQELNKNLNLATMRFFAVAENYPNLKSSEQFLQLQSQIEGAENRINITRMQYNASVKELNAQRRVFPSNIVASLAKIEARDYFKAEKKAHEKIELDL